MADEKTKDGRKLVTKFYDYAGHVHLSEIRVYICRLYGAGAEHVGTGLTADAAEASALEWARKCGTGKKEMKAMLTECRKRGDMKMLPAGVTHFAVGAGCAFWEGGEKNAPAHRLEYRENNWHHINEKFYTGEED